MLYFLQIFIVLSCAVLFALLAIENVHLAIQPNAALIFKDYDRIIIAMIEVGLIIWLLEHTYKKRIWTPSIILSIVILVSQHLVVSQLRML